MAALLPNLVGVGPSDADTDAAILMLGGTSNGDGRSS
jgi:hypothetical protein